MAPFPWQKQWQGLKAVPVFTTLNKRHWQAYLFLMPSLLGTGIFYFFPLLDVIRRSFYEAVGGRFMGFENYHNVMNNEAFKLALKNTLRFIAAGLPVLFILSLLLAILLQAAKAKSLYLVTLLLPLAIPVACSVLFFRICFIPEGWLNQLLPAALSKPQGWLKDNTAFYTMLFCYLWKNMGYDMVLWSGALTSISPDLYEAAKVDGAGRLMAFRYITAPLIRPFAFTIVLISLLNVFKIYREAYLLMGNYPSEAVYMLQHLFNNWFIALDIQKLTAAAVLVALGLLVILFIFLSLGRGQKAIRKRRPERE